MKYFKNTSWLLGEYLIRIVVNIFVFAFVVRYLGPSNFGLLSYAFSLVGLFIPIATLGLDVIVVRELVKDQSKRDLILGTAIGLRLAGSLLLLILLFIVVKFTSNDSYTNALIFITACSSIFQIFSVIDLYFQSRVLSKYVVYANMLVLILSSTIKIALVLSEVSVIYFAIVFAVEGFAMSLWLIYFYYSRTSFSIRAWRFNLSKAKKLLKDSYPLMLSTVAVSIYMKIDQVMLKEMLGISMVGQYAAAVRLTEAWYPIAVLSTASLFPAIIEAKEKNKELYYSRLQKLYDLILWLAIAIAVISTVLGDWFISILYGSEYAKAAGVFVIYIWSNVFVFIGVAGSKWYIAENLQSVIFYRSLYAAVINVALNLLLIPVMHIYGAAVATLLSYMFAAYLFDLLSPKTRIAFRMKTKSFFIFFRKKAK